MAGILVCRAEITTFERFISLLACSLRRHSEHKLPPAKEKIQLHFSSDWSRESKQITNLINKTSHVDSSKKLVVNESLQYIGVMGWKCGSIGSKTSETISFETARMNANDHCISYFAVVIVIFIFIFIFILCDILQIFGYKCDIQFS